MPGIDRRSLGALCAVGLVSLSCATTDRRGPKSVKRVVLQERPIDAYTYRIEKRGALGKRPRSFMIEVERSQSCITRADVVKTYDVTTTRSWPSSTTWLWTMGGAGALLGYFVVPKLFEDDDLPDDEQPLLADPFITGMITAGVFVIASLLLPDGDTKSRSTDKERTRVPDETKSACTPFTAATGVDVEFELSTGTSVSLTTDGRGRAEIDVDTRAWQQSISAERFATVKTPDGRRHVIEMSDALRAHATKIVERAKRQQKPPRLSVFAGFEDTSGNSDGVLDAGERAELVIRIENSGGGTAYAVTTRHRVVAPTDGTIALTDSATFGDIPPAQSVVRRIVLDANERLGTGKGEVTVEVLEEMGFGIRSPYRLRFDTKKLRGPKLDLAAYEIFDGVSAWAQGDGKNTVSPGEQIELRLRIANTGEGVGRDVVVRGRSNTRGVSFVQDESKLGRLAAGQTKMAKLVFRVTNGVTAKSMKVTLDFVEARNQFNRRKKLSLPLEQVVASTKVIDVTPRPGARDGSACPDATSWVVAVMEMRGQAVDKEKIAAMTRQLHIRATQRRLKVVSKSAQDEELARLVKSAKAESFKECYDERCQVELGKALAASHLLVSSLETFGGKCTVAWEVLELKGETTVCGNSARGGCDEASLLETIDRVSQRLPAGR